ncbi:MULTISPECIES: DUF6660 family protein [Pedobacter]|nr:MULTISPECIES: DUF6660 family protein [Pedobacter]MCZ4224744.1 hypothetical protein [Pedobacter sp. SJ11]
MKISSLFLCFIIVILSCIPCADVLAMGKLHGGPLTEKSITTHSTEKERSDFCSPFCVCSCCNTTSEVISSTPLVVISKPISSEYNEAYMGEVISLPLSVWQPPKLS